MKEIRLIDAALLIVLAVIAAMINTIDDRATLNQGEIITRLIEIDKDS